MTEFLSIFQSTTSTEAPKSEPTPSETSGTLSTRETVTSDNGDDVPTVVEKGEGKEKTLKKITEMSKESTSTTTKIEKSTADELKDMNYHRKITSKFSTTATIESSEEIDISDEMESTDSQSTNGAGYSSSSTATTTTPTLLDSEEINTKRSTSSNNQQKKRWWQSFKLPWWEDESGEKADIYDEMESKVAARSITGAGYFSSSSSSTTSLPNSDEASTNHHIATTTTTEKFDEASALRKLKDANGDEPLKLDSELRDSSPKIPQDSLMVPQPIFVYYV